MADADNLKSDPAGVSYRYTITVCIPAPLSPWNQKTLTEILTDEVAFCIENALTSEGRPSPDISLSDGRFELVTNEGVAHGN